MKQKIAKATHAWLNSTKLQFASDLLGMDSLVSPNQIIFTDCIKKPIVSCKGALEIPESVYYIVMHWYTAIWLIPNSHIIWLLICHRKQCEFLPKDCSVVMDIWVNKTNISSPSVGYAQKTLILHSKLGKIASSAQINALRLSEAIWVTQIWVSIGSS